MNKQAVKAITDALPADILTERLKVSHHSVRHARTSGQFPASWYGELREMCAAQGIDCPLDAFNWKTSEAAE